MIELGSVVVAEGSPLFVLRASIMAARSLLVEAGWPADPMLPLKKADLDRALLKTQSAITKDGLNSKYAEKARMSASDAILEQVARARRTFFGRIANIDARNDRNEATCLPEVLLDRLAPSDIAALKKDLAAPNGGLAILIAEARLHADVAAIADDGERTAACANLPPRQGAIVWVLGHVLARYDRPEMDAPDKDGVVRSCVQLHLDAACLRPAHKAYPSLLKNLTDAAPGVLRSKRPSRHDFVLTGIGARGDGIPIHATLAPKPLLHAALAEVRSARQVRGEESATENLEDLGKSLRFRSVCIEIGPDSARCAAVVARAAPANSERVLEAMSSEAKARKKLENARKPTAKAGKLAEAETAHAKAVGKLAAAMADFTIGLARCSVVFGVDPGRRDAMVATPLVIPHDRPLSADRILELAKFGQTEMHDLFTTCRLQNPERGGDVIGYANGPFLELAKQIGAEIDKASRAIDVRYKRIEKLKLRLNDHLGRRWDAYIPKKLDDLPLDHLPKGVIIAARKTHCAFFIEYGRVLKRKADRCKLWGRLHGAKKSWFGMLANRLAVSALALNAGVALEDSDWGVQDKDSESYWGPKNNRVMAAVSPRKLLDTIKARLDWSGVVWWNVPSWYTSKSDFRYCVVDGSQRPNGGKVFTALTDGMTMDADEHSGETMAAAALLCPDENLVKPSSCGLPELGSSAL
jgi:hypothetical protein